jgi:predicted transcriptional regulator
MRGSVALRNQTKKIIDQADIKTVRMVFAMLEAEKENDWWDTLDPKERGSIERGIKDAEEGRVYSNETVMKKIKKWRSK